MENIPVLCLQKIPWTDKPESGQGQVSLFNFQALGEGHGSQLQCSWQGIPRVEPGGLRVYGVTQAGHD